MHRITRRPSPAMGVALFALFFAMGGGAYAAKHYLITSTKQISPKVLKALKGKSGKIGPAGATGPAGPAGAAGVAGAKGDKGDIGPSTAYAAFHDDVIDISSKLVGSPATVATLGSLPAGSYTIQAKLVADSESASEDYTRCTLSAEGDNDYADDYLGTGATGDSYRAVYAMQLVHTFSATGGAAINCYHSNSGDFSFVKEIKITAIRLGSIASNTGV